MIFVKATEPDLKDISLFVNLAYRGEYSKLGWTTEADLLDGQRTDPESLSTLLKADGASLLKVIDRDKLIGCVYLKEEKNHLYFGMLTVEPQRQNQGLAKLILSEIEKMAVQKSLSEIRLTVIDQRTELIAYYERRGFVATGYSEPFPENEPRFGLPKKKMSFLEFKKSVSSR